MNDVTLQGNPVKIAGRFPQAGDQAPDFTLTNQDLEEKSLSDFSGQRKVLTINPSVDTGVCAATTRQFNARASSLSNTVVLGISADLPFAQARFCGAEGLDNVIMLSCFRHPEFAKDYGVAIEEGPMAGLCARAVVVLDESDRVIHAERVAEITDEPDYDAALAALS